MKKILSRQILNYGNQVSLRGYLSTEEFMKTLSKTVKQSTLAGFAAYAALTILGDFENWYIGPYKMEVATLVALALGYLRARTIGLKYLDEGDEAKKPDEAFLPSSISGLALRLDATDASTLTPDGSNNVSEWRDKSGNARHATVKNPSDRATE